MRKWFWLLAMAVTSLVRASDERPAECEIESTPTLSSEWERIREEKEADRLSPFALQYPQIFSDLLKTLEKKQTLSTLDLRSRLSFSLQSGESWLAQRADRLEKMRQRLKGIVATQSVGLRGREEKLRIVLEQFAAADLERYRLVLTWQKLLRSPTQDQTQLRQAVEATVRYTKLFAR